MNPARLMLNVGLLVTFASVAWAVVEFRPMPAGLSVQVTSATPLPTPTLQKWIMSKRTVTLADSVTFSALVVDCPSCSVRMFYCQSADLSQCSAYTSFATYDNLNAVGDGWFNQTYAAPIISGVWPRGVYHVALTLVTAGGDGVSNSYPPSRLEALFGAGSITLTDFPIVASPPSTVDYFTVSPTTVTALSDPVTLSMHFTELTTGDSVYFRFTPSGVGNIGLFGLSGTVTDGWYNTTRLLSQFDQNGPGQANVPYVPYALVYLNSLAKYVRLLPRAFINSAGVLPTLTLSGAAFSGLKVAPNCNFTLTPTVSVTTVTATITLAATCDRNIMDSRWALAGPAGMTTYFYGQEQLTSFLGGSVYLPEGSPAGVYSVYSIFVSDASGNVAVYGNNSPPLLNTFFFPELNGEGWMNGDELNRVFGEASGGTTASGAHGMRGAGFPAAVCTAACVAFAAVVWRFM